MDEPRFCVRCGAALPESAVFCPRCGAEVPRTVTPPPVVAPPVVTPPPAAPTPVAKPEEPVRATAPTPPPTAPPPRPPRRHLAIGVPLAIVALILIVFAILAGMPYGQNRSSPASNRPEVTPVQEGEAPPPTAPPAVDTVMAGQPNIGQDPLTTTGTIHEVPPATGVPPSGATPPATRPPATTTQAPAPRPSVPAPRPAPPAPTTTSPPAVADTQDRDDDDDDGDSERSSGGAGEISESEALATLREHVLARGYYSKPDCVDLTSHGYKNVGYTIETRDRCEGGRMLDQWRVDSKTREVFRRRSDGRFLKP